MSSNRELVPAETADLHLRKHAIFAASIVLAMVIGVIVVTSTPSRKKGREEEVFLFRRTLRSKGGSASPTLDPKTCFDNRNELGDAVEIFIRNESEAMSILNETYGLPIGTWCFSESLKNMSYVFYETSTFNEDISTWDTSNVEDMSRMFYRASSFNGDLAAWDVAKVSTMQSMFQEASAFNQDLSSWETSSVENLIATFRYASSFNKNLAGWDVSKVSTMQYTFLGATSFDQTLSSWDTSRVEDMSLMFDSASSFNKDLSAWDVSKVSTMREMFQDAVAFNLSLCSWGTKLTNDSNVDDMFYDATSCPNIENNGNPNLTATVPGPFCYACN
jgi:surface protein